MNRDQVATVAAVLLAAVVAVGAFSGGAVGAGELTVSVTQDDDGSATVEVTENDTAVADANVSVELSDGSETNVTYNGTGEYVTDENGTVGLSAPEQNVTVDVTATKDNRSGNTTTTLLVASALNETTNETAGNETNESFGQAVSAYVFSLQNDTNRTGGLGPALASWVVANNPGNAPSHAGPPADLTRGPPADVPRGPPENAGPSDSETRGPPENRTQGPPEAVGPSNDGQRGNGNGNGPPADRGPDRDEDDDEDDDRGNGGPPDNAGPK
jgi:hypothetical protein